MSWTTSTWDWLTGQDQDKQARAYYAKEKEVFHKLVASREHIDRYEKKTGRQANATNKRILDNKIANYKARQNDLKARATTTRPQGYLVSFSSFISKWSISGTSQIGVIPLIPLVVICFSGVAAYVTANYLSHAKQADSDSETIDKLLAVYDKTGDKDVLTAIKDIRAARDSDETGLFGRIMSVAKTAGNIALWGGLALGALWLYNNENVRSLASGARDGAARLKAQI